MKRKKNIPDKVSKESHIDRTGKLTPVERQVLGLSSPRDEKPDVSLKHYGPKFQCFREWDKRELKSFSAFVKKLRVATWTDIHKRSGNSGEKVGFGMAYHKNIKNTPLAAVAQRISLDTARFFELRVGQKARVRGFRCVSAFFLVCLDRNHEIHPQ